MRPVLVVVGCVVACEDTEDWELVFPDAQVPFEEVVRQPAAQPADADAWMGDDATLDLRVAKMRATTHRGSGGRLFASFQPYLPATPNGEEAANQSRTLFVLASAGGVPYLRRHGVREAIVDTAPFGGGLVALVCDPALPPLVYHWTETASVFAGYAYDGVDPSDTWEALGLCAEDARLGASDDGAFLVAADGQVHRATVAPFSVHLLGPAPVDLGAAVWLDALDGAVEGVTWDGAALGWSDGARSATADPDGELVGDPVWRGSDGALRVATTAGVYRWAPPEEGLVLVAATPLPGVGAGWEVEGGALLATETTPNDRAPELDVPVATAVAMATDAGWVTSRVQVTPCVDDDTCRLYGESEVIAVAGDEADRVVLYDLWTWRVDETHATWAVGEP